MRTITPAQLQQLLIAQPDPPLLDVRTPIEYAEIHAPRARRVPLDSLGPQDLFDSGTLSKDQLVYLICRAGGRGKKAAEKPVREGFSVVLKGGAMGWTADALPIECGATKVGSLERQVRIVGGSLVLSAVRLGSFVHRGFFDFSRLVGAGLALARITGFCGMGLLLAKLPWKTRNPA